mgnify:FL=1|tara:strand:+ start:459 stop:773 length:315 start_codon:yes stop_codon:yes gene_type:complete
MKKISLFLFLFSVLLTSCQSIKDGLTGVKRENSDEFLVQKKNPLVLPPNFNELPSPADENFDEQISDIEDETNIENILGLEKNIEKKSTENYGSAEDFVLKKIK